MRRGLLERLESRRLLVAASWGQYDFDDGRLTIEATTAAIMAMSAAGTPGRFELLNTREGDRPVLVELFTAHMMDTVDCEWFIAIPQHARSAASPPVCLR